MGSSRSFLDAPQFWQRPVNRAHSPLHGIKMDKHRTNPNQDSPLFALVIGFTPSAALLVAGALGINDCPDTIRRVLCVALLLGTLGCCFFCSRILFGRKPDASGCGAIVILVLNIAIALFLGCATIG
jgi:hypothetical protein